MSTNFSNEYNTAAVYGYQATGLSATFTATQQAQIQQATYQSSAPQVPLNSNSLEVAPAYDDVNVNMTMDVEGFDMACMSSNILAQTDHPITMPTSQNDSILTFGFTALENFSQEVRQHLQPDESAPAPVAKLEEPIVQNNYTTPSYGMGNSYA